MKLCMVGYGSIAECHMQAFGELDRVDAHVLVGRRPQPTAAFAHQWGFRHHTLDLDEALADGDVDAVVVTSPSQVHAPQAMKVLAAGKHLLLEIPMALNYADAEKITRLSRSADRRLMICHSMRFMPAMVHVRRQVEAGQLHLHHIVGFFGIMRRDNTSWTGKQRSWTDNILWHHCCHLVDLSLWMTGSGDAQDVHCRFGPAHPTQGIMDISLSMVLPGQTLVSIAQSYNMSAFRWRVLFIGREATFEFDTGRLLDGEGNVVLPRESIVDLRQQNSEFVAAVRQGRDPAITGEEALGAMRALQAAQDSAENAQARSSPIN
jgi:2-hydroxy-4-carboxymuconate semialdehyde hemiacetal dehydrogenase